MDERNSAVINKTSSRPICTAKTLASHSTRIKTHNRQWVGWSWNRCRLRYSPYRRISRFDSAGCSARSVFRSFRLCDRPSNSCRSIVDNKIIIFVIFGYSCYGSPYFSCAKSWKIQIRTKRNYENCQKVHAGHVMSAILFLKISPIAPDWEFAWIKMNE